MRRAICPPSYSTPCSIHSAAWQCHEDPRALVWGELRWTTTLVAPGFATAGGRIFARDQVLPTWERRGEECPATVPGGLCSHSGWGPRALFPPQPLFLRSSAFTSRRATPPPDPDAGLSLPTSENKGIIWKMEKQASVEIFAEYFTALPIAVLQNDQDREPVNQV